MSGENCVHEVGVATTVGPELSPVHSAQGGAAGAWPGPQTVASKSRSLESVLQVVIMLAIGAAAGAGSFTHVSTPPGRC